MKTLLAIICVLIAAAVQAQTVTNLAVRVTVDVIVTGVSTNSTQSTLNLKAETPKEKVMLEALSWVYDLAQKQGETNEYSFFLARTQIKDYIKDTADQHNRAKSKEILNDITVLLTTDIDLLTQSDLNSLATIANKAP